MRPEILNLESKVKTEILNVSDRLIVCKQQCILSDLSAALGLEFDSSGGTEWRNQWCNQLPGNQIDIQDSW